jgi:3-phenylpropionate/cinnamic acid dioxygenase small subunit
MTEQILDAAPSASGPAFDPVLHGRCAQFLCQEADLLDRRQFEPWLGLLHPDLQYVIPVRLTVNSDELDAEFSPHSVHSSDSYQSIEMRVRRLQTEHAFAENPPSRTNRLISNIAVRAHDEHDTDVRSKFLLYRSHGGSTTYELVTGTRHDVLRDVAGEFKLVRRTIYLAHTTLPTLNLGVFL